MRTAISIGLIAAGFCCNASAQTVSVDLLRHPITPKVRQSLRRAIEKMESGDHEGSIAILQETLAKHPDSATYVDSLLGVEYLRTARFQAAVSLVEDAVLLLPHDAMTHYNFGIALIVTRKYDRATREIQRALELDPKNAEMKLRLDSLLHIGDSGFGYSGREQPHN